MTGTDVARCTHKQSRSYLNHLVYKMKHLEVSGAVRPLYGSLGVKRLRVFLYFCFVT